MKTPRLLAFALAAALAACSDPQPTSPTASDVGLLAAKGPVRRPINWLATPLLCPDGAGSPDQLQSVYPLDGAGDLILVGHTGCPGGSEDWTVYDLSSGQATRVASIDDLGVGTINLGAHSPPGSEFGFGVSGTKLVVYDGSFDLIDIPCTTPCPNLGYVGVWAASPTDVWVIDAAGRIRHWDGADFTLEHDAQSETSGWGLWGFGGSDKSIVYAAGDGILRRDRHGTWNEDLSPAEYSGFGCGIVARVRGRSPNDVWVNSNTSVSCILHFDGRNWTGMPQPTEMGVSGGIWPLDAKQILVSGQGGVNLPAGKIALWGSLDGGQSWTQFSDPLFTTLPSNGHAIFFDLAATQGGQRIYAPGIAGTLLLGSPN